ncbi:MAG: hypothetical protein KC431_21955 [Myxococcales bacterium]|nr:hypothetical protein [Myxococcales bacterium]
MRDSELELHVEALGDCWRWSVAGTTVESEAARIVDDGKLAALATLMVAPQACAGPDGTPVDSDGRVLALAQAVGSGLFAALPPEGQQALRALCETGGRLRVRVSGRNGDDEAVMRLPWELLWIDGSFPVAEGRLELLRTLAGADAAQARDPLAPLSLISLVAAPAQAGFDLERASLVQPQILAPLRGRVRRTDFGSLQALQTAADLARPSLLHFVGGIEGGRLLFEARFGEADAVSSQDLLRTSTIEGRAPAFWLSCRQVGATGPGEAATAMAAMQRFGAREVFGLVAALPPALFAAVDAAIASSLAHSGDAHQAVAAARERAAKPFEDDDGSWWVLPLGWALPLHLRSGPAGALAAVDRPAGPGLEREPIELAGIGTLPRGFVGRRRLLQSLEQARMEAGDQSLAVYGPPGSGRTATLLRMAVLLLGRPMLAQRVVGVRVAATDFAGLRRAVGEAVSRHSERPEDWDEQLAAVDAADDPGSALARALLAVGRGRKAWILDELDGLQRDEAGTEAALEWADEASARFFATLTGEVPKGCTVLLAGRGPIPSARSFALPPYGRAELLEIAASFELEGEHLEARVVAAEGSPGTLLHPTMYPRRA